MKTSIHNPPSIALLPTLLGITLSSLLSYPDPAIAQARPNPSEAPSARIAEVTPPALRSNDLQKISLTAQTKTFKHAGSGREAKLRYPIVTGVNDPTLQAKLQNAIDLKTVFGRSIEEMETDFQENYWLRQLDYTVNYNDRGMLSLTYSGDGVGAYPSGFARYQSVNLKTGEILRPHHLFKTASLGVIARLVDRELQAAIQTKLVQLDQDKDAQDIDRAIFRSHQFRIRHLNDFTLTPEGIQFHYRFDFPRVLLAAEPNSDFLIPYSALKDHWKDKGSWKE